MGRCYTYTSQREKKTRRKRAREQSGGDFFRTDEERGGGYGNPNRKKERERGREAQTKWRSDVGRSVAETPYMWTVSPKQKKLTNKQGGNDEGMEWEIARERERGDERTRGGYT